MGKETGEPQHTPSYIQVKRYITVAPIWLTNFDPLAILARHSVILSALVS